MARLLVLPLIRYLPISWVRPRYLTQGDAATVNPRIKHPEDLHLLAPELTVILQVYASGGSDGVLLSTCQIPAFTASRSQAITVTPLGFNIPQANSAISQQPSPSTGGNNVPTATGSWSNNAGISGTNNIIVDYTNASQGKIAAPVPVYMGGITMIRAA